MSVWEILASDMVYMLALLVLQDLYRNTSGKCRYNSCGPNGDRTNIYLYQGWINYRTLANYQGPYSAFSMIGICNFSVRLPIV